MKLVSWNTQWCCGLDGVVSPERIVATARQLADVDLLCLQEIAVNYAGLKGGPGHDQPALLRALLPGFELFYGPAVDEWDDSGQRRQFGNLIATRLPVVQLRHHALPYPADAGVCSMPRACTVLTVKDPALGTVRVMTTHLEFYSRSQREAQARAVRELHIEACAQAALAPRAGQPGTPFQPAPHTAEAILCGDFNAGPDGPEHALLQRPFSVAQAQPGGEAVFTRQRLWDGWRLAHGRQPQPPTFHVHDRRAREPIACDFVFVSDGLKDKVRRVEIDAGTTASDHQPVLVELS